MKDNFSETKTGKAERTQVPGLAQRLCLPNGFGLHKGFGLVEMAIVVIVVGIIISSIMPRILGDLTLDRTKKAKFSLEQCRDEIMGYASLTTNAGRLPAEDTSLGLTYSTVPNTISSRFDAWDENIGYIVANDTSTGTSLSAMNVSDATGTDLEVRMPNGDIISDVAFVVFSIGKNKNLELTDTPGAPRRVTLSSYGTDMGGGVEYDDLALVTVLSHLQSKTAAAANTTNAAPRGSDVSQGEDVADFDVDGVADPAGSGTTVNINADGTVSLGGSTPGDHGCLWYQGNSAGGNCVNGNCELNYGIRAFFRFKFNDVDNSASSGDYRAGFTFALIDGDNNASDACGRLGHTIGYGCDQNRGGDCLDYPKLAVEIDTYPNGGDSGTYTSDGTTNHAALVYWSTRTTGGWQYNDVNHRELDVGQTSGNPNYTGTRNPENVAYHPARIIQNSHAFHSSTGHSPNWLEDGVSHTLRMEIYRNATAGALPENVADGSAYVNATVWIDCNNDCSDLTQPYNGGAEVVLWQNTSLFNNATWNHIRAGWTEGTGSGAGQDITISDFGLKFLNQEPDHLY